MRTKDTYLCGGLVNAASTIRRPITDALSMALTPVSTRMAPAGAYRPRVMTADALSLIKRTVWLVPRTTTCITPEKPYSLL